MHWSRYIDLGIAAFLVPLSMVVAAPDAELLAVTLWPGFLACLLILVVGIGTDRVLGRAAAFGALVVAASWAKLGGAEFMPGRIDHHNVQILCASVALYLSVWPGARPVTGGIAAGAATALSLAVGLEMVPLLALIWGMAALRFAFGLPRSGAWLAGYAPATLALAPLLVAGDRPLADMLVNHCDVLAPPVFSLLIIGFVATLTPVLLATYVRGAPGRIAMMAVIAGAGLWLVFPLIGPCLSGPYAQTSPEVREIIATRIVEARTMADILTTMPAAVAHMMVPVLLTTAGAAFAGWRMRRRISQAEGAALIQMLIVVVLGIGFSLVQNRAINLAAPALPFLGGFLFRQALSLPRDSRARLPALLFVVATLAPVVHFVTRGVTDLARRASPVAIVLPDQTCRSADSMSELNALPPSVIFSSIDLGAAMLAYTSHSVTSAPYHRSNAAFWNGFAAMERQEDLRTALISSDADYLILCRGSRREARMPFAHDLAQGRLPAWLAATDAPQKTVIILKVIKGALSGSVPSAPGATGDAP